MAAPGISFPGHRAGRALNKGLVHCFDARTVQTGDVQWVDTAGGVILTGITGGLTVDDGSHCPAGFIRKTTLGTTLINPGIGSGRLQSPGANRYGLFVANMYSGGNATQFQVGDPANEGMRVKLAAAQSRIYVGAGATAQLAWPSPTDLGTSEVSRLVAYAVEFTASPGTAIKYIFERDGSLYEAIQPTTQTGDISQLDMDSYQTLSMNLDGGFGTSPYDEDGWAGAYIYYFDNAFPADLLTGLSWMAANPLSGPYNFLDEAP